MTHNIILFFCFLYLATSLTFAQKKHQDTIPRNCFVSTSAFMIGNVVDDSEPPAFYQLNVGYRITPKDIIILEAITWKYYAPLGIPYASKSDKMENFPGYIQDFGIGLAYQRFIWKGLYSTVHTTPFVQHYYSMNGDKIKTGFQLFTTLRLGYHISLFKDRFFVEPSVACTYWPINTNLPESFAKQEDKWPNYFLFEPGLHVGFNF